MGKKDKKKGGPQKPKEQPREPGCTVLPEDMWRDRRAQILALLPQKRHRRGRAPRVEECQAFQLGRREVESRILRAMQTLRAMPDQERRFFHLRGGSPDYVQDYIDAYASVEATMPKFRPTPFDVSDYLRALAWTRHLHKNDWRILWWRSFGYSFGLIAEHIGRSDEAARQRYGAILTDVWCSANNVATGVAA
jgi:hypothetical protein